MRARVVGGYGRDLYASAKLAIIKMASRAIADPLYGYPIDEGITNLIAPMTRMTV